jgi:hypothetical protein
MKGAAPVPPSTSNSPINNKTRIIGVSHHFLLCNRKSTNSPTIPLCDCLACSSKSRAFCVLSGSSAIVLNLLEVNPGRSLVKIVGNKRRSGRLARVSTNRYRYYCRNVDSSGHNRTVASPVRLELAPGSKSSP